MIRIKGGHVVDPVNGRDGPGDLWINGDRIVDAPTDGRAVETVEASGAIVMAGGIDIHSHIAGASVNTARLLLPETHRAWAPRPKDTPLARIGFDTATTGRLYAQMGFTTVIEPAMMPSNALHAHLELADTPIIDKGALCVLGNDDFLLSLLRAKESAAAVRDYVSAMVESSQALGVKVINAGASAAFKENARTFSLDDVVPAYGVSSRQIVLALQRAVEELGIPHPLHIHCNNLGVPGNAETAVATMAATDGRAAHLAHLQFYGYGKEGKRGFSSAAATLAAEVNRRRDITVDIGQVMFGQTVTVSCDTMRQFTARGAARPKKWVISEADYNGAGIVPYRYNAKDFYNAIQWATGLELFLLIDDPWRVFFTTDHPNGAPFTTYPEIFALLMDRSARAAAIEKLPKSALAMTTLPFISREYSLAEIAIMTRAAPARLLGLKDRGHLGAGALADVAIYKRGSDVATMFREAQLVLKNGEPVVRKGRVVKEPQGKTLTVKPGAGQAMARRLDQYFDQHFGLDASWFRVPQAAFGNDPFAEVPCRS
ncbi:MAG: formylmethanofuran dehydrogenase subunit A [Hyphomicrobiales bacterium]